MKVNKVLEIIVLFLVLYVVQFFIMPNLLANYYPCTNEATIIYLFTVIISVVLGMFFISDKMFYWFIGNLFYFILVYIYSANGAYGIGIRGITLDGTQATYSRDMQLFSIAFFAVYILSFEIIFKILKNILFKR